MADIIPTIGRIVIYRLSDVDVDIIGRVRAMKSVMANAIKVGDEYPAMIVRVWGTTPSAAVNLKVMMDGDDTHWATSRVVGDGDGDYHWMEYQKKTASGEIAPTLHTNGPVRQVL